MARAATAGLSGAQLRIAVDNSASRSVAAATGFTLVSEPLVRRERKGQVLMMQNLAARL